MDKKVLPIRHKKIKKGGFIKALKIQHNFESFYSGGELLLFNQKIILALFEGQIKVFDLEQKTVIQTIDHQEEEIVNFLKVKDNLSDFLYTFTQNGILRFFKICKNSNGKIDLILQNQSKFLKFLGVEMQRDKSKKYLIMCDPNGTIKIIDANSLLCMRTFKLGMGYLKMRMTANHIYFLSKQREIVVYNMAKNLKTKIIKTPQNNSISNFILLNKKNQKTLFADFSGKFWIHSKIKGSFELDYENQDFVTVIENFKIGELIYVLIGYQSGALDLAHIKDNQLIKINQYLTLNTHPIGKIVLDFSSQSIYVVSDEAEIFEFKMIRENGKIVLKNQQEFIGINDQIFDVKFLDDDTLLVSSNTETLRLIDLKNFSNTLIYGHSDMTICFDFLENTLVTGLRNGQVYLWNRGVGNNFELIKKYQAHQSQLVSVKLFIKKDYLLTADSQGFVKLWNLSTQTCKTVKTHNKELNCLILSDNEKFFITGSHDRSFKIYSVEDLQEMSQTKAHQRGIWDVAINLQNNKLATCSSDMLVKIWNIQDLKQPELEATLEGSLAPVLRVKWNLRFNQVVAGTSDGQVLIFDVKKASLLKQYENQSGRVWAMDIRQTQDGLFLMTGDNENGLVLWKDDTEEEQKTQIIFDKQKIIHLEKLKIFRKNQNYEKSLEYAFQNNMNRSFFDIIKEWINNIEDQEIIYQVDLDQEVKINQQCPPQLTKIINKFMTENPLKLLNLIKNFITKKSYDSQVDIVLKAILAHQKAINLCSLQDKLLQEESNLSSIFQIFKIFNKRNKERKVRESEMTKYMQFIVSESRYQVINQQDIQFFDDIMDNFSIVWQSILPLTFCVCKSNTLCNFLRIKFYQKRYRKNSKNRINCSNYLNH